MARLLSLALFCCVAALTLAQEPADTAFVTVRGTIRDASSRKALVGVNISLDGSNISTVTNGDGTFSLTVPATSACGKITALQIGYLSTTTPLSGLLANPGATIQLQPSAHMLRELIVRGGRPEEIVAEALRKIPANYCRCRSLFTAFYRETVRKGSRYIGVSEAIVDVLKTPYTTRTSGGERVQIRKGRSLVSQNRRDTLSVKIVGGPTLPVIIYFVKNADFLFGHDDLDFYSFTMEKPVTIDQRLQYVVRFAPRVKTDYALCRGILYIDQENLAFSKAEFELDMSDRAKATAAILRRKPRGLRFSPREVAFTVEYRLADGVSYLSYIRTRSRFRCDWKRRLFSSGYTTDAEMVMVDRTDCPARGIRRSDAFGNNDIFSDRVASYWDPAFWRGYNIIEPTESLDKAVKKLRKSGSLLSIKYE